MLIVVFKLNVVAPFLGAGGSLTTQNVVLRPRPL